MIIDLRITQKTPAHESCGDTSMSQPCTHQRSGRTDLQYVLLSTFSGKSIRVINFKACAGSPQTIKEQSVKRGPVSGDPQSAWASAKIQSFEPRNRNSSPCHRLIQNSFDFPWDTRLPPHTHYRQNLMQLPGVPESPSVEPSHFDVEDFSLRRGSPDPV